MNEPILLNPDGRLLVEIDQQVRQARKTKSLWARRVDEAHEITSLEGRQQVHVGDMLCRGIRNEIWSQKAKKLLDAYDPSGDFDEQGWQRFDPKPDAPPVDAAQVNQPFRVIASWGVPSGKAGDFVVRSTQDASDIWIVDQAIFKASYEMI